jgi:hypothetical protein
MGEFSDVGWSCRWGETSQNCGHQRAYCSSPGWYVSVESRSGDDTGWEKLLTRPPELSGNLPADIWERVRGMDGSSTCQKSYDLTSHPLRIFTALKNPSLRPGLNPRPLRPLASTLTTKLPRRLFSGVIIKQPENQVTFAYQPINQHR